MNSNTQGIVETNQQSEIIKVMENLSNWDTVPEIVQTHLQSQIELLNQKKVRIK
jgi:hypothetical protein